MGWIVMILLALALLLLLWRFGGFGKAALQLLGAALLIAMAGYSWQGQPSLVGKPVAPPGRQKLPPTIFAQTREKILGTVDTAARWLTLADHYHEIGDNQEAVGIIRAGIRAHPRDAELWAGLGNALVIHAGGMMSPAAELAFSRALQLAPEHPGPKFYYGLALAQGGKIDEAERLWRDALARGRSDAAWRGMIEERLMLLAQIRRLRALQPGGRAPLP